MTSIGHACWVWFIHGFSFSYKFLYFKISQLFENIDFSVSIIACLFIIFYLQKFFHSVGDHKYQKLNFVIFVGIPFENGKRFLSFDGDADRIVYYYQDKGINFNVLRVHISFLIVFLTSLYRCYVPSFLQTLPKIFLKTFLQKSLITISNKKMYLFFKNKGFVFLNDTWFVYSVQDF